MAHSCSSFPAGVTGFIISVTLVLSLTIPTTITANEEYTVSWNPYVLARYTPTTEGIPIPFGDYIQFDTSPPHTIVRVSQADYSAGKVDNPIEKLPADDYGTVTLVLDEPGWYFLVSDYPGDYSLGYKLKILVGNPDCPRVGGL